MNTEYLENLKHCLEIVLPLAIPKISENTSRVVQAVRQYPCINNEMLALWTTAILHTKKTAKIHVTDIIMVPVVRTA